MRADPIGPVMIDLEGLELSALDKEKIAHPNTGAIILFARNYDSPEQIQALVQAIRDARNGPMLVAVDQEGGRVQRFRSGFTRLPPAASYAAQPELAETAGWLMATEVLSVGVDFSFAPVLDVDCGVSEIIGDRAFSQSAEQVAEFAGLFLQGMRLAGMAGTGKHFPGHGAVAADSHLALPVDNRPMAEIRVRDLLPFQRLIQQGLLAVMPAHVVYPEVDAQPAGFSEIWLQRILRGELGFDGAIFSDDLSMEGAAAAGDFLDRALSAQHAGCDMLLVCNNPGAAEQVLESLPITRSADRERRLLAMRGRPQYVYQELSHCTPALDAVRQIQRLSDAHA